jgi:hypothetical protein
MTWGGTTTAGNTLVVYVQSTGTSDILTTSFAVQGSDGTYYTKMPGTCGYRTDGTYLSLWGFYHTNSPAETYVLVTPDFPATLSNGIAYGVELQGANSTSPLDQCSSNSAVQSLVPDGETSGTVTTTANGEAIVSSNVVYTAIPTAGTGYTGLNSNGGPGVVGGSEYKIQTSAGSVAGTWTGQSTAIVYIAGVSTFKK